MNEFKNLLNEFDFGSNYFSVPSINYFTDELKNISSFEMVDDFKYEAKINIDKRITSDNINIELNEENNSVTLSYGYSSEGSKISMSMTETLPKNVDYDSMKAVLNNGELTISFETKEEEQNEKDMPISIKINRL